MRNCIVFGDIHFGEKNNSEVFNKDCLDYIDWLIEQAKERNIKTCFFLGDWNHVRSSLNIKTLKYSLEGIRKLSSYFNEIYMIIGNHDLYYRESLKFNSLEYTKEFKNITLVQEIMQIDDCTLVPWILDEEYKKLKKIKTKFVFGHFELPGFLLNSMVKMPELGHFKVDDFNDKIEYVLSGHFHKRQYQLVKDTNIHYIGSAFPHNFSDANDTKRGCCIIENDALEFLNWGKCPNYLKTNLDDLLENGEYLLNDKTYAKVTINLNLMTDEINFIRETYMEMFGCRELSYVYEKDNSLSEYDEDTRIEFKSVDSIVLNSIEQVESQNISKKKLIDIYNNLSKDIKEK